MPRRRGHPIPPPRPRAPNNVRLTRLWQTLPPPERQHLLRTLSRVIAQQLPRPPAAKEAGHEHA
jgi:hypothetical protein